MARKRKSRNNKNIGHGAISRIGRPHNPFEPRRNRYAQKYLTLLTTLMVITPMNR
ncbi:TPA: hypothetical protein N6012_003392 [Escherichia coli]|nr:hypothetical protein [Escherichia coli]HBM9249438.1 hypothetical protein [Escherichia coli]HCN6574796.1 hypothetical protein [Escherichia coli]HEA7343034.1 hypothetical protein [Escherichia coli]HEI2771621.1 hypothetical protein [Escherichia coli]